MKRSAYFDNAKAILIYFVVLGHLLSNYLGTNEYLDTFYLIIYLFHMPAFIFIAGHFSKKVKSLKDVKKLIKTLLLPYVVFQFIYSFYYVKVFGDSIEFTLFEPRYALWFLLSMLLWKMMLSIFGNHKGMIIVSIVISLIIGYVSEINEWLSLSRTFFFFPFFLMGYFVKRTTFEKLKNKWNILSVIVGSIILVVFVHQYVDIHWREWLLGRVPYDDIYYPIFDSAIISRLVVYLFMFGTMYLFLSLVPTKERWYTAIGEKTLCVYLLHLFIIRAFKGSDLSIWIEQTGNFGVLIIIAFAIVYVLSLKWVFRITKPIMTFSLK